MLTIKQITEDTDKAIRALEKKHFKHAKETIAEVIRLNDKRKAAVEHHAGTPAERPGRIQVVHRYG